MTSQYSIPRKLRSPSWTWGVIKFWSSYSLSKYPDFSLTFPFFSISLTTFPLFHFPWLFPDFQDSDHPVTKILKIKQKVFVLLFIERRAFFLEHPVGNLISSEHGLQPHFDLCFVYHDQRITANHKDSRIGKLNTAESLNKEPPI